MEDYGTQLKKWVTASQERVMWYKKELEEVFKNKNYFHPEIPEDFKAWWKDHLREMKNIEELGNKGLVLEAQYFNSGLNPPFCYRDQRPLKTEFMKIKKD